MSKEFLTIEDFRTAGKTVLLRVDVNSPLNPETGEILDDTRMKRHIPTIRALRDAKVVLMAHQGRPGSRDFSSLEPHARRLSELLGRHVKYVDSIMGPSAMSAIKNMRSGEIILLENTRFYAEEVALKKVEQHPKSFLVKNLAAVADLYVNDAFAASHRTQPSLTGFLEAMPCAAGVLMQNELENIFKAFKPTDGPSYAVLGGMKVDDSIKVMDHMLTHNIVSDVLTVGVVGNLILKAQGHDLGEPNEAFMTKEVAGYNDLVLQAKEMLPKHGEKIHAPSDLAVSIEGKRQHISLEELPAAHPIFDIGIETISHFTGLIESADKVILNGPAGVFEIPLFSEGTFEIFKAMARCKGYTIMGGGHTSAVAEKLGVEKNISHISTGGGALITYLSGGKMPVIDMLKKSKELYEKGAYKQKCE
ncbi:MAG: phosphoglycerate kinase [Candidatus Thermoplasmatota archaeon]|nr:phosphoglycerate kinase [Candidatus Thermoplasmatota archaeon]